MPAPFVAEPFTFHDPDGTPVEVRGWGNQYHAVFETPDGYTVVPDPETGDYCYAVAGAGELASSGSRVGQVDPATLGVAPHLRPDRGAARVTAADSDEDEAPRRWEERRAERRAIRHTGRATGGITGDYVGLCVLVQFPDVDGAIPPDEVDKFCNQQGYTGFGNNGSVRDYFRDVSDGKLSYTNVVTRYLTASRPRRYYAEPSVRWPRRAKELAVEVLQQLVDEGFDFGRLSVDDRGFVYAFNLFYAGKRVNRWSEGLWPGATALEPDFRVPGGGPIFRDLQWTDMGDQLTIGTFCHENGHMLCDFPDLYDYQYNSSGAGRFCLMSTSGGKNPVQVGAYLKAEAGWASRRTVIDPSQVATVEAGRNDFHVWEKDDQEYFIVENRQQTGRDASLPASGLAIWHVDERGSNSDEQMTPERHYECSLEQADGRFQLERTANHDGDAGDLFGAPRARRFADDTTPDSRWWNGRKSGLTIRNISAPGPTMTFGGP
ncbi:M6 family metalloprotease domain-containing protein [Actinoplanes sp. NPDC049596]|uniref:M6 family metalloprotease domain-containing protein n=1 Tax=unclassified Actinoplanes TaxID=2626549 RepID=UPI0034362C3C